MHEPPADALRRKKDSSMRVAINLVKDGARAGLRLRRQHRRADGDLALRAEDAARHRPAGDRRRSCRRAPASRRCSTSAPTSTARPSNWCSSRSWAARWWPRSTASSARPSACSTSARRTSRATTSSRRRRSCSRPPDLNFYGNVEGNDIYKGTTDVVVCDGFVGNVALKTSEGLATMLYDFLQARNSRAIRCASCRRCSPSRC